MRHWTVRPGDGAVEEHVDGVIEKSWLAPDGGYSAGLVAHLMDDAYLAGVADTLKGLVHAQAHGDADPNIKPSAELVDWAMRRIAAKVTKEVLDEEEAEQDIASTGEFFEEDESPEAVAAMVARTESRPPDGVTEPPVPFVAIANGEAPPWAHLDLFCPECGTGPLPLKHSDPPLLQYISHCGKQWLRGSISPRG